MESQKLLEMIIETVKKQFIFLKRTIRYYMLNKHTLHPLEAASFNISKSFKKYKMLRLELLSMNINPSIL